MDSAPLPPLSAPLPPLPPTLDRPSSVNSGEISSGSNCEDMIPPDYYWWSRSQIFMDKLMEKLQDRTFSRTFRTPRAIRRRDAQRNAANSNFAVADPNLAAVDPSERPFRTPQPSPVRRPKFHRLAASLRLPHYRGRGDITPKSERRTISKSYSDGEIMCNYYKSLENESEFAMVNFLLMNSHKNDKIKYSNKKVLRMKRNFSLNFSDSRKFGKF